MTDLILRTSIILAATWVVSHLLSRATAATRHFLWHVAIVAVLAAPLLMWGFPKVPVPMVPWVPEVPMVPEVLVPMVPKVPIVPAVLEALTPAGVSRLITEVGTSSTFGTSTFGTSTFSTLGTFGTSTFGTLGTLGTVGTLVYFLLAYVFASRLTRNARAAPVHLQQVADALAATLGVKQVVPVRIVDHDRGPFTTGLFRPMIVLPIGATGWHPGRLRTVLLHELAHVRRHDCRTQALAQLACALYWFNPLIWIAARNLRRTREAACDDHVLTCGVTPHQYAADLLDIARACQPQGAGAVLAMGRRSDLESRLLAIVASGRVRVPAPSTRWIVAATVAIMTTVTLAARATHVSPDPVQRVGIDRTPVIIDRHPVSDARGLVLTADAREKATLRLALDSRPDVIPALIAALADADSQVREKAALGLALRGDERVIDPLVRALADRDPQVREKAAIALGTTGSPKARDALERAIDDADPQVREKAVTGLTLLRLSNNPQRDGERIRSALRVVVTGLLKLAE
jgi:beta-lactamase regulating signal transducer with metallopeptidase domain